VKPRSALSQKSGETGRASFGDRQIQWEGGDPRKRRTTPLVKFATTGHDRYSRLKGTVKAAIVKQFQAT